VEKTPLKGNFDLRVMLAESDSEHAEQAFNSIALGQFWKEFRPIASNYEERTVAVTGTRQQVGEISERSECEQRLLVEWTEAPDPFIINRSREEQPICGVHICN
jgi:hypothetical protein